MFLRNYLAGTFFKSPISPSCGGLAFLPNSDPVGLDGLPLRFLSMHCFCAHSTCVMFMQVRLSRVHMPGNLQAVGKLFLGVALFFIVHGRSESEVHSVT